MNPARFGMPERLGFAVEAILENFPFGIHESMRKGEGLTFASIRDYQEGDPMKRVDWMRSMERSEDLDELLVREFDTERKLRVVVMVDVARGMHIPQAKASVARALLWLSALSAFRMRDSVHLHFCFDPDEGGIISSPELSSGEDVSDFLRAVRTGEAKSVLPKETSVLEALGGGLPPDTFLVVISDLARSDERFAMIPDLIAPSRHSRLLFAVLDEWQGVAPISSLVSVSVGDKASDISGRAGGELERMKREVRARQERSLSAARKRGHISARIPVFAKSPFDELVWRLSVA
jgi:uncharacterized protein (DUF58 family)